MASIYLSICSTSKPLAAPPKSAGRTTASASSSSSCFKSQFCGCFVTGRLVCSGSRKQKKQMQVVSMAPDEEKLTRRSPLDFPIGLQLYFEEWERPKPGSRPDIFPKFSPMKTPIPPPLPYDPPEEDEEEEEEKKKEEEEEDPEKEEEPDKPEKQ